MRFFDEILEKISDRIDDMNFSDTISVIRRSYGIQQRAMSRLSKMHLQRLRNLESGNFVQMPREKELKALSYILGISYQTLKKKAEKQTKEKLAHITVLKKASF